MTAAQPKALYGTETSGQHTRTSIADELNYMRNIELFEGAKYPNKESLMDALRSVGILSLHDFDTVATDKLRVRVACHSQTCPWRVLATQRAGSGFEIRICSLVHTCTPRNSPRTKLATARWVANRIIGRLLQFPSYKAKDIVHDVRHYFGVEINHSLATDSKNLALKMIQGAEDYPLVPGLFRDQLRQNDYNVLPHEYSVHMLAPFSMYDVRSIQGRKKTIQCGNCGELGYHNRATCPFRETAPNIPTPELIQRPGSTKVGRTPKTLQKARSSQDLRSAIDPALEAVPVIQAYHSAPRPAAHEGHSSLFNNPNGADRDSPSPSLINSTGLAANSPHESNKKLPIHSPRIMTSQNLVTKTSARRKRFSSINTQPGLVEEELSNNDSSAQNPSSKTLQLDSTLSSHLVQPSNAATINHTQNKALNASLEVVRHPQLIPPAQQMSAQSLGKNASPKLCPRSPDTSGSSTLNGAELISREQNFRGASMVLPCLDSQEGQTVKDCKHTKHGKKRPREARNAAIQAPQSPTTQPQPMPSSLKRKKNSSRSISSSPSISKTTKIHEEIDSIQDPRTPNTRGVKRAASPGPSRSAKSRKSIIDTPRQRPVRVPAKRVFKMAGYAIDHISDREVIDGTVWFNVHWRDTNESTPQTEKDLIDAGCRALVTQYK